MPIHIGTKKFEDFHSAVNYVKKNMPQIAHPQAYVGAVYWHVEKRRK